MLSEIALFLLAVSCVLLTLSSAFGCLDQDHDDFKSIPSGFLALWEMLIRIYPTEDYERLHSERVVLVGVFFYLVVGTIFLMNLLIAQLCCSYSGIYADMVGYARLKRCRITTETMPMVPPARWDAFKNSLGFENRIEFNEGDVGVAGGIQVKEEANKHPTTVDTIKRVGGPTSITAPWPQEATDIEEDKFGKIEALLKKVQDTMASSMSKKKAAAGSSLGSGSASGIGSQQEGSEAEE